MVDWLSLSGQRADERRRESKRTVTGAGTGSAPARSREGSYAFLHCSWPVSFTRTLLEMLLE